MKKNLLVFLSFWSLAAYSQGEMTLPIIEHVYQSSYYIPTAMPDHKVSIGLPGLSSVKIGFVNTGFLPTSGLELQNNIQVLNVNKFIQNMPSNNLLNFDAQTDFFHIRIKRRNSFVSLDAGNTTQFNSYIPKSLFEFGTLDWTKPNSTEGRTFDFSNLNASLISYNHYSIGINKIFKHFNVGGRLNLLQGLASSEVKSENLQLAVSSNAISINNSLNVNTSGSKSLQNDPSRASTQFKNLGGSIDLGFTYKIRERLFLGVSANNLGFIQWNNDLDNTKYYQTQTNGPFKGVDVFGPILRGDSLNVKIVDSLKTHFKTGTDSSNKRSSYRTWLTPRVYLSVNYKITNRFNVTALVKLEKYIDWRYALTLGAQYKFGRFLSVTATSTYQFETISFGGGIVIKPGPFQIYVVGDNLFSTLYNVDKIGGSPIPVPLPYDARMLNLRVGINFVLGRILDPKKQSFNYQESK